MKRNIAVCCEQMLRVLCDGDVAVDPRKEGIYVRPKVELAERDLLPMWFSSCPYGCGTKLPFPYEEKKNG